ncbi:UNVERIFIED_CONTAM: hypothetical protein Slati_4444900 [Sesamum latifolium]|uniref:Uncharacterized protein n=1 Tax=Sesamum latifolium TaxID=2727402 RepID=A0AAW2SQS9_9LAMI
MPRDHSFPVDYYNTKKLIRDLGLPMEKIVACKNCCMCWKDDIDLDYCKFYGEARYKPTRERNHNRKKTPYAVLRYLLIISRLQRLYASQVAAEQMTWHANHHTEEASMCHPSDAEAWRHFDRTHPNFSAEPRNVRLARRIQNIIDVYLEPLIEELQNLWHVGVLTRDSARDETFVMRAPLMWTVNDLPAYRMGSGLSSAGVMGCPICMEDIRAFYLQNDRKACYFDCHIQFLLLSSLSLRCGSGASKKRWLSGSERHIIETYILTNCEVVTPYYESFLNELYEHYDSVTPLLGN